MSFYRIKIKFKFKSLSLPYSYQYYLSSLIYNMLLLSDSDYANYIHTLKYKPYSFSALYSTKELISFKVKKIIFHDNAYFIFSTVNEKIVKNLICGFTSTKTIKIFDQDVTLDSISFLSKPQFDSIMEYKTLSPIVIAKNERVKRYLFPKDPEFYMFLKKNITNKIDYLSKRGLIKMSTLPIPVFEISFSKWKTKRYNIKTNYVIGVLGEFNLIAPYSLHELIYYLGIGQKTGMGFGCIEVLKENK